MSKGNRNKARKLRAAERARQDQAAAAAREFGATHPRAAMITTAYADPGTHCSWCDCPDGLDGPHRQPGYECGGCPRAALYVTHVLHGTPEQHSIPSCEPHQPEVSAAVGSLFPGVPVELHVASVLDDEDAVIVAEETDR